MKVLEVVALSCVLVPLAPAETRCGDDGFVVQSLVPPAAGQALYWAVLRARHRLDEQPCQGLFSEFSDASGRTLQENLDALGQTAGAYLGLLLFADGSDRPLCRAGRALAFTTPGSRVVYICSRAFKSVADRSPVRAEAGVIHEALHTLGLGENPPSSSEITARVLARCHW